MTKKGTGEKLQTRADPETHTFAHTHKDIKTKLKIMICK